VWDPEHDPNLPQTYGLGNAESGKQAAKSALQRRLGLEPRADVPLFGVVSRLTPQKGLDLLLAAVPELAAAGAQLALLGSGDADLEHGFSATAQTFRGSVGVEIGYDEALSHLIIGGADVLVMPSRFEPCGLTQLYALRYGTLPLVHRVGGLADTVVGADAVSLADGTATGFSFDQESSRTLLSTMERAGVLFRQRPIWQQMIKRAMTRDFSWNAVARQYLALYRQLLPGLST